MRGAEILDRQLKILNGQGIGSVIFIEEYCR